MEIHYKILHNYIACNNLLYKMNIINSPYCNFCQIEIQDCQHLFYYCVNVQHFWYDVELFLLQSYDIDKKISLEDVLFGIYKKNENSKNCNIVNIILVYCKQYIFGCKVKGVSLNFDSFQLVLNDYLGLSITR